MLLFTKTAFGQGGCAIFPCYVLCYLLHDQVLSPSLHILRLVVVSVGAVVLLFCGALISYFPDGIRFFVMPLATGKAYFHDDRQHTPPPFCNLTMCLPVTA